MNIERQRERTLIGIEARASNDNPQAIGEVWQRFLTGQLADRIPDRTDGNLIAVYCDYDGDHTQPYTFFLGCATDGETDPPEGFATRLIPAGRYARCQASGPMPATLMNEWTAIWSSNLNRSYLADFEIHDPAKPELVVIYVGVT